MYGRNYHNIVIILQLKIDFKKEKTVTWTHFAKKRKEYWSGLLFPSPGDLPDPRIKPASLMSPAGVDRFSTTSTTWEAHFFDSFFLTAPHGMWDLVPQPGIKPASPALEAWSLNHWTTREVPKFQHILTIKSHTFSHDLQCFLV